ncbi:LamG-like jellyroll fold domain-containing protein [Botrimarina sp.]|uniref:LamG-like jellyroll fold domain-containing protein n=1 Tax=Botrimarina sp. TaxID=2795802 RepID=UPI0032EBB9E6
MRLLLVVGLTGYLLTAASAFASTVDRLYQFGDLPLENPTAGADLGSGLATAATIDSAGIFVGGNPDLSEPNVRSFANLQKWSNVPSYVLVNDRPDLAPGETSWAASFSRSSREAIYGPNLNFPQQSFSSQLSRDPNGAGPFDYSGVTDRYLQFWVKPNNSANTQVLVMDTFQHGVRINDGKFSLRYAGADFDSPVAVEVGRPGKPESNGWYHVMLLTQDNLFERGNAVLYVDGVAVAAITGDYQTSGLVADPGVAPANRLTIDESFLGIGAGFGGSKFGQFILPAVREPNYFDGVIDELEMGVIGFNRNDEWGAFDFLTENQYAAAIALPGVDPADVNLDGLVQGDGTGPASVDDVTAFVENFFSSKTIPGVIAGGDADSTVPIVVGDIDTRSRGDLNIDGVIDLADWSILNAANPTMAGLVLQAMAVPEPTAAVVVAVLCVGAVGSRRRN